MVNRTESPAGRVVVVDLRDGASASVEEALKQTEHDLTRRFLVIDGAADLVGHQLLHERLYSHGPARLLCLAVGAPEQRQLRRPLPLGPPEAGVLWLPDTLAGAAPGTERFDASLRPLLELLLETAVFDSVLRELADVPQGVAVPAVRVLEHDLTDDARSRSWRQALEHLAGQDVPAHVQPTGGARSGAGAQDGLAPGLSLLLGQSVPRSLADRPWLIPGGRMHDRHEECLDALDETREVCEGIRGAAGLFGRAGKEADLPARFERLADALAAFRAEVAGALGDGGGDRVLPEQRSRLMERGIELTEVPEVTRAGVGPALRGHTERLLGDRLPLRSVAARLSALADRSAPAGSTARLRRLDEACPPERVAELSLPPRFTTPGPWGRDAGLAFLICCVAGLWPVTGWVTGPLTGLVAAGLAVLMLRRRPGRSRDGGLDGGGDTRALTRLLAGVAGGVIGAAAGLALSPPPWVGPVALVAALAALVLLAVRDWTAAVDDWWSQTDWTFASRAVSEVDELLADTVVHDWLLADARYHCSDAARAVALLVRGLADTVEARLRAGPAVGRPLPVDEPGGPSSGATGGFDWDSWGSGADDWSDDPWSEPLAPDAGPPSGPDFGTDSAVPRPAPWPEPAWAPDGVDDATPPADDQQHALRDLWPSGSGDDALPWLERETGDGGPELVDTLVGDLTQGAVTILATRWAAVEREPATAGGVSLRPRMDELLDEEHRRLGRDGAAAAPPYAPDPANRPGIASLLGVSADRVGRLLGEGGAEHLVPLCGAEHRRLLSKDPQAARLFRFAPEAMRRGAEPDTGQDAWPAAEDVVWTAGGRHAGVLKLVPMRPETVRSVRGEEGGAP
ncbi:hypothetical protein ABZ070_11670 [Streptomyces sp. NPDC006283]|uniref:hypothetical protein n=1 Tax=Streptomyces sp. NPDC006283 TaxID=3156741 RepID=UPI0033B0894C